MIVTKTRLLLVALVVSLAAHTSPALADRYNDPLTQNDDRFDLDLTRYEPGSNIDDIRLMIDTDQDEPRYYRLAEDEDRLILTNPREGEEA